MKKILLVIICGLFSLFFMPTVGVRAEGEAVIGFDSVQAERGETVTITVSVSGNAVGDSLIIIPSFDKTALEAVSGEWLFSNALLEDWDAEEGAVILLSASQTLSGDILKLEFKIKEDAPLGEYTIGCEDYAINNGSDPVSVRYDEGCIEIICSHNYGDWERYDDVQHKKTCSKCGSVIYDNHAWDQGEITKEATCKETGTKTYTCSVCHATKQEEIPKLTEHTWDEGVVKAEPTHLAEGEMEYTCKVCGAKKTEPIEKIAEHSYGAWAKTDDETHSRECACGDVQMAPHVWDEGVVKVGPTHLAEGEKEYTCKECCAKKTEPIEKIAEHSYGAWVKTDDETHSRECACGDVQTAPHAWDEGVVKAEPTHLAEGEKEYTCKECCAKKTEPIEKIAEHSYGAWVKTDDETHSRECACGDVQTAPHAWDEGVVKAEPTHLAEGEKEYTCKECCAKKTEPIEKIAEHSYGAWVKTDDETHSRECACGDVQTAPHAWDEGVITKQATCKEEGTKKYVCTDCGTEKSQIIPKTEEHVWKAGEVLRQPTCKEPGLQEMICTVCGESKTVELPKLTVHTFGEYSSIDDKNHERVCAVCGMKEVSAHSWDTGRVTVYPTETTEGMRVYVCKLCGTERYEKIPLLTHTHDYGTVWHYDGSNHWLECRCGDKANIENHTFDEGTVIVAESCETDGVIRYTCTVCGYTKDEAIPASHIYGNYVIVKEPTCMENGLKQEICERCGQVLSEEVLLAIGSHTFGDWEVVKAPTTTETGLAERVCAECGSVETKILPKVIESLTNSDFNISVDFGAESAVSEGSALLVEKIVGETDENLQEILEIYKNSVWLDGYDIALTYNGAQVSLDEAAMIKFTISPDNAENYEDYKIFYIDADGVSHEMNVSVEDNTLTIRSNDLGRFMIIGIQPEHSANVLLIVGIVILVVVVIGGIVGFIVWKNRKKSSK